MQSSKVCCQMCITFASGTSAPQPHLSLCQEGPDLRHAAKAAQGIVRQVGQGQGGGRAGGVVAAVEGGVGRRLPEQRHAQAGGVEPVGQPGLSVWAQVGVCQRDEIVPEMKGGWWRALHSRAKRRDWWIEGWCAEDTKQLQYGRRALPALPAPARRTLARGVPVKGSAAG